jgi:dTMP kinase
MARKKTQAGLFISFEGGEGSGKTTQIRHLIRWLKANGQDVLLTRQPGGTPIGMKIRNILLDPRHRELCTRAELLLYEADRAQDVEERVLPALAAGITVVTDRFADSSSVYQGICRNLGLGRVIQLNDFATGGLEPDISILLDLSEKVARQRIRKRVLDRMEREELSFHRKVRQGFLELARRFPKRIAVFDGSDPEDLVADNIQELIREKLMRRGLWKTRR